MNQRIMWLVGGVLGVGLLIFLFSGNTSAQPRGGMFAGFGPPSGRFVVAHAGAEKIVVLDTATGMLYQAKEADFKKIADLPKIETPGFGGGGFGGGGFPGFPGGDKERDKETKKEKDGDRPPPKDRKPRDRKDDEKRERE